MTLTKKRWLHGRHKTMAIATVVMTFSKRKSALQKKNPSKSKNKRMRNLAFRSKKDIIPKMK